MLRRRAYEYQHLQGSNKKYTREYIKLSSEHYSLISRADKNFTSSKSWIHQKYVYIWKFAYKAYHLSTADRQRYLKTWQSNIAFGLIRSFIDVFVSTLTERPITFSVNGLDEQGIQNSDNIRYTLAAIADATGFQKESRYAMKEGLKTGTFAFYVGMLPKKSSVTMEVPTGDPANPVETVTYSEQISNFPFAKAIDVFNIFPDVYNGTMRHCSWRQVTSLEGFHSTFSSLINDPLNESPLKDMGAALVDTKNSENADHKDYTVIKDQVHQQINWELSQEDSFPDLFSRTETTTNYQRSSQDEDPEVTDGLIECILYTESSKMVLWANGYPVYIGDNPNGFIPFVLASTNDEKKVLGCEGVPYLLAGMEKTMNSFMNNYLDNVRATANKTYIARKGLFSDDQAIEDAAPGSVIYSEMDIGTTGLQAMDKGTVSDYNILDIVIKIASQLTGISEYNLGISARERTATGAAATTQSSQKRLSPFLESYMGVIARIAYMWLYLTRKNWLLPQFVAIA